MTLHTAAVKRLRSDALRLEAVARHLRQQAKQLVAEERANERAENARANFYRTWMGLLSKPAQVDSTIPLVPNLFSERGGSR